MLRLGRITSLLVTVATVITMLTMAAMAMGYPTRHQEQSPASASLGSDSNEQLAFLSTQRPATSTSTLRTWTCRRARQSAAAVAVAAGLSTRVGGMALPVLAPAG